MENSKKLSTEEIRSKAESWAYLCRQIGSRINWSDAFVSGYRTCENEKDALLKEAIVLLKRVLEYSPPPGISDDINYFLSKQITGSEAREQNG